MTPPNRRNDACDRRGICARPFVPSVFPSAASPDGKTEVMFKPASGEGEANDAAQDDYMSCVDRC